MIEYIEKNYSADYLSNFGVIEIIGDINRTFSSISNLDKIKNNSLIYITEDKFFNLAINSEASLVVITVSMKETAKSLVEKNIPKTFIVHKNPKLLFAKISTLFKKRLPNYGISDQVILKSKVDPEYVEINSFVTIDENVIIGKNVIINSFVTIGKNCRIGEGTIIFPGVKIYENCEIGKNCIIHANTVIGADGFGFVPENEKYQKIEHFGKIIIEDDVEIGANCCIDRATIGETRIGKGTKIDNLVQIAHNVSIGENCMICAQVGIAGGAKIGNHVIFAGQVGVSDHAIVEDNVIAGAQSGLTTKKYEKNSFLVGSPALDAIKFKKSTVIFSQLPDFTKDFYSLKEKILKIEELLKTKFN